MKRIPTLALTVAFTTLVGCGKPLQTKQEFVDALGNAAIPATAAKASGAAMRIYASAVEGEQDPLPSPSISVRGTNGGEAILSVNPVGLVVGLVGRGILFDMEYRDYSADGINYLYGNLSVLANFDYLAAIQENPNANFQISFIGDLGIKGFVSDKARLNLTVTTNVAELMTHEGTTQLHLNGKVNASQEVFEFADEDVTIDWQALAERAQHSH